MIRRVAETDHHHRYLSFKTHAGQSAAFRAGFVKAQGSVLATLDGDGQNDPADIPLLVIQIKTAVSYRDLLLFTIAEADKAYADGRLFHHFVMTTSNHRPYTYPDGKIDIPSHTGRKGAVKYTDYTIGEFIRKAKEKPWFSNTVFIIVADHCANSAGKADLTISRYKIPLIFYNPELLKPQKVDVLCSQIDYAPTLLGMFHWSYESRFFGKNAFLMGPAEGRAFISTYQKLGYMHNNTLAILKPVRDSAEYRYEPGSGDLVETSSDHEILRDAVVYYETANYLYQHRRSVGSPHITSVRADASLAREIKRGRIDP
jgi:glycosyltransferase involved in cell wall biosynthesis